MTALQYILKLNVFSRDYDYIILDTGLYLLSFSEPHQYIFSSKNIMRLSIF